jgi:hypothetical protein
VFDKDDPLSEAADENQDSETIEKSNQELDLIKLLNRCRSCKPKPQGLIRFELFEEWTYCRVSSSRHRRVKPIGKAQINRDLVGISDVPNLYDRCDCGDAHYKGRRHRGDRGYPTRIHYDIFRHKAAARRLPEP